MYGSPASPWHRGYVCGWVGWSYRAQACVCLCPCSARGLSCYLRVPEEAGRHAPAQLNLPSLAAATVTQSSDNSHQTGLMRETSQPDLQE